MSSIIKVNTVQDADGNNIINESGDVITVGASGDTVTVPGNVVKSNALQASDAGNIISQSGTTITVGASGDTVTIPSGATQTITGTLNGAGAMDLSSATVTLNSTMKNTPNFRAYQNAIGTVLTQNTYTKVVFDSEYYDSNTAFATGRFTVPSGKAGKYFFSSTITMQTALAEIALYLYKNGSAFIRGVAMNDNNGSTTMVSGSMDLSVGDYVEVYVRQNQSSNRVEGITSGSSHSSFEGFRIIT